MNWEDPTFGNSLDALGPSKPAETGALDQGTEAQPTSSCSGTPAPPPCPSCPQGQGLHLSWGPHGVSWRPGWVGESRVVGYSPEPSRAVPPAVASSQRSGRKGGGREGGTQRGGSSHKGRRGCWPGYRCSARVPTRLDVEGRVCPASVLPRRASATAHCWARPSPGATGWWTPACTWPPAPRTCAAAPPVHVPPLLSTPASVPMQGASRRTGGALTSAVSAPPGPAPGATLGPASYPESLGRG